MVKKDNNYSFKTNVKKSWKYIRECKNSLFFYALVSVVEAVLGAVVPIFSAKVILNMTNGVIEQLILSSIVVFALDAILYIAYFFKGFFYQKIYRKTLINLQIAVAKETLKLEVGEIDKASSGVFIDRLNKDTGEISALFMEYAYWISYVISNIGVLVTILILNKYLFGYALITCVILFLVNRKRISEETKIRINLKKLNEKKTGLIGELVRGIRDIKVMNAYDTILKQTSDKIIDTSNEEVKMQNVTRIYHYIDWNIRSLFDLIFIIIGCILYNNAMLTIPTFVIVYNYLGKIKNLLSGIVNLSEYNKKFVVSAERIFEIIDGEKFKKESFGNLKVDKLNGNIKFVDVEFGYNKNNKIINKMNFEILPNEKVAFVGKSGAGKSTLFGLITRMYTINKGKILLDDNNIYDLDRNSLRDNMSIITQSPYIFNFSIKENLLLAKPDAKMSEIRQACKLACIDDYIMSLPKKYNTMVGESGVILSGGQKQRLAIARALLMKTEIILFDEATSALDNETQSEIQNAIDNLKGEYTILIVAHRLSTIIDADKIFLVEDGKITASGTHKQLLKNCEDYKKLYESESLSDE